MEDRDYSNIPEADVLVNYICDRKKKGLYTLGLTSGLPGSGKSSSNLRMAELVSIALTGKNIITSENIFDDLIGFVKFVKESNPKEVRIAIVEEISVLFPSRRAMAEENVSIGKILDTCRKKQVIVFANAPLWTSIDSHLRALGNVYVETLRINKEQGVVISKVLRLQTNPSNGKTYFHWLKRNNREVHRIITRMPNMETWEAYELKKDKFMDNLYKVLTYKAQKKVDKLTKDMGSVGEKAVQPLSPMQLRCYDLKFRKKLRNKEIARELEVVPSRITQLLDEIKQKVPIFSENPSIYLKNTEEEALK